MTEQYNKKVLSQFPKEVYGLLPNEVKKGAEENQEDGGYDFDSVLQAWSREGQNNLKSIFDILNKEPKRIAQRQVFINRTQKLKEYCQNPKKYKNNSKDSKKLNLSDISKWILDEWKITTEGRKHLSS